MRNVLGTIPADADLRRNVGHNAVTTGHDVGIIGHDPGIGGHDETESPVTIPE